MIVIEENKTKSESENKRALLFSLLVAVIIAISYVVFSRHSSYLEIQFAKAFILFLFVFVFLYVIYSKYKTLPNFSFAEKVMQFKPNNFFMLCSAMFFYYCFFITCFVQITMGPDTVAQLLWFNGYDCFDPSSREALPGYWLSDQHPFLDTLIYGAFWKLGEMFFSSGVFGLRILVYLQVLFWCPALVLSCYWIKFRGNKKHANLIAFCVYIFMLLNPLIPMWIAAILKDVTAMPITILWLMMLIDVVFPIKEIKKFRLAVVLLVVFSTFSLLTRRSTVVSAIFVICGLFCVTIFRFVKKRKVYAKLSCAGLLSTLASLIIACVIVPLIAYPALKISPVGPQESLSLPIQQTIGILKNHKAEISQEDLNKIDAVVPVQKCLNVFNETSADSVKDLWKRNTATSEDKNEFIKTWLKLAFKYPGDALWSCRYLAQYAIQPKVLVDITVVWWGWSDEGATELFSPIPEQYQTENQLFISNVINEIFDNDLYEFLRVPISLTTYTLWLPLIMFGYVLVRKNYKGFTSLFIPYSFAVTLFMVAAAQGRYAAPLMFFVPIIFGCVLERTKC